MTSPPTTAASGRRGPRRSRARIKRDPRRVVRRGRGCRSCSSPLALTASVRAQEVEIGRATYLENCAACHGADGSGGGEQGSRLKAKPADLTLLARRKGGVFSSTAVYAAIDGRKTLRAHRDSGMPIWGCRHDPPADARTKSSRQKSFDSFFDLPCDSEPVIRERIRAVVHYLSLIQKK